ncbi:MAG: hypothetical protein RMM58_04100 [Chloroflexota bacterium]|nr:hypothetical protein [Dehalococcoidia bacterium]MDW8253043.1 hypothetical protein [Chloroflexota bacterium]
MEEETVSFRTLLRVLAAIEPGPPRAEGGEPLSYALWTMAVPSSPDPDPRPRSLLHAYLPREALASQYLNATV